MDQAFTRTSRRKSRSDRVDYTSSVLLSENSRTRIEVLGFIYEKGGTEHLSVKINFSKKEKRTGRWQPDTQRSSTLDEEAVGNLKRAIARFEALLGQETNSDYLLVPLGRDVRDTAATEKATAAAAFHDGLYDCQIASSLKHIALDKEICRALKNRVWIAELERATNELTLMLDADEQAEIMYQKWFEEHSWVLGNAYVAGEKAKTTNATDRADLLMKMTRSGAREIVELKRPDAHVLSFDKANQTYFFSVETAAAIGQCQCYLEAIAEEGRDGFPDANHIFAHDPEAKIVIGRSVLWSEDQQSALRRLNQRLIGIKVMTFDHVLARARAMLDSARSTPDDDQEVDRFPF